MHPVRRVASIWPINIGKVTVDPELELPVDPADLIPIKPTTEVIYDSRRSGFAQYNTKDSIRRKMRECLKGGAMIPVIYMRSGSSYQGHAVTPGGLHIICSRILGLVTLYNGDGSETVRYSLTNSDVNNQYLVGLVDLDDILAIDI